MLRLATGDLTCEIAPALGGCITSLRWRGLDVLRPAPAGLASSRQSSSYPLVPWSNRIGHGVLHWQGGTWALAGNNAPEPHAIHGVGWQDAWQLEHAAAAEAVLRLVHAPDARWPFAFEARQHLRLAGDTLQMQLEVVNRSPGPMPAGVGWHPFFVKRPGSRVRLRTRGRWEMGPDKLPTERVPHPGLDQPCAALDVDHCFDGWDGVAQLQDEAMQVRLASSLRHVVVFTTPSREAIAIEPVSHVNNVYGDPALADRGELPVGAQALAPGERLQATASIELAGGAPP